MGFDAEEIEKAPESYTPYAFALMKASEAMKIEVPSPMEMDIQPIYPTNNQEEPPQTYH
jgi:hypothetical protein